MNVLGIMAFGENPAAALLIDGQLVAFAEEERFTRLKGSNGFFPSKAVNYCLKEGKVPLGGINRIAFGWDCSKYPFTMAKNFSKNYIKYRGQSNSPKSTKGGSSSFVGAFQALFQYHPSRVTGLIHQGLREAGLKGSFPKVEFVPHHLAHAFSSYFCSNFSKAGILTLDGSGEDICTQLAIGEGETVRVVDSIPVPNSLGWFFAAITQYLGMIPYRDEGKLMGLAALGEHRSQKNKWIEPLSKILSITDNDYLVNPTFTKFGSHYYANRFTDKLVDLITSVNKDITPVSYGEQVEINGKSTPKYFQEDYIDIAWAAQELLERAAIGLARKLVTDYGVENICIAGGVGMNCKMNGEILRKSGCKNIFVQPASSDGGTALGAAMIIAQRYGDSIRNQLKHTYWGPGFSNDQIKTWLDNSKLSYKCLTDPAEAGAKFLAEGKIIAWHQGRMEFGARALGGRSILANPVFPEIKNKVNIEVKYRESWRPFCPSMIEEAKENYLVDPNESSYMTVAYHVKDNMKDSISSAVHVDNTVRPQTVSSDVNPLYHSLISSLGKKTGHPVVLNTSFNVRGEPIICTPLEAIRCFYSCGLDAIIIGDFLLGKS